MARTAPADRTAGRRAKGALAAALVVGIIPISATAATAAPVTAAPVQAAAAAPTQWYGQSRYEYYSGGLTMHYYKGQAMALADPNGHVVRCFSGSWVAPGTWRGYARDTWGHRVHATAVRSTNGKHLTVRVSGHTASYNRTKSSSARRAWGSVTRAKRAADLCWGT